MIQGINHITFEVKDLERSIRFYQEVLEARLTAVGETQAYFDVAGIWLALNVGESNAPPHVSYDHVAFTIEPDDLVLLRERLHAGGWIERSDRERSPGEAPSLYLRDPDGHLLEFHTGSHQKRLQYLRTAALPIKVLD